MEKSLEVMMDVDPQSPIPSYAVGWLGSAVGALFVMLAGTWIWLFKNFNGRMKDVEKGLQAVQQVQAQDTLRLVSRDELTNYMRQFRQDLKERDDRKSNQDTERHVENRVQLDRLVDGLNNVRLESREDIGTLRTEICRVEEGIANVAASAHKRIDDILKER